MAAPPTPAGYRVPSRGDFRASGRHAVWIDLRPGHPPRLASCSGSWFAQNLNASLARPPVPVISGETLLALQAALVEGGFGDVARDVSLTEVTRETLRAAVWFSTVLTRADMAGRPSDRVWFPSDLVLPRLGATILGEPLDRVFSDLPRASTTPSTGGGGSSTGGGSPSTGGGGGSPSTGGGGSPSTGGGGGSSTPSTGGGSTPSTGNGTPSATLGGAASGAAMGGATLALLALVGLGVGVAVVSSQGKSSKGSGSGSSKSHSSAPALPAGRSSTTSRAPGSRTLYGQVVGKGASKRR